MEGNTAEVVIWLGRVLLGGFFVVSGLRHYFIADFVVPMIQRRGVPAAAAVLATGSVFEAVAGAALMAGWQVLLAAVSLILFTIAATIMMLNFWSMSGPERVLTQSAALTNVAVIGGLMLIAGQALNG